MTWIENRTFRAYRFRKRSRTVSEASEEAYLRDDIPCGSEACSTCSNGLPALSADASHYVIPDSQALDDYLEVFELPQLQNFVLLASVLQKFWQTSNIRKNARMRSLYRDVRRKCTLFDNLHFAPTSPLPSERHTDREIERAARWFYGHLDCHIPIVVLSSQSRPQQNGRANAQSASSSALEGDAILMQLLKDSGYDIDFAAFNQPTVDMNLGPELKLEGVEYMHPSDYFKRCWGNCGPVLDLFESLEAAKQVAAAQGETCDTEFQYPAHLGASALDDALSSGKVLQGTLHMSRRGPTEGVVRISHGRNAGEVLVSGRKALNRAIHGDVVAVQLLPRNQWPASSAAVIEEDVQEASAGDLDEDDAHDGLVDGDELTGTDLLSQVGANGSLQPSGEVVAIVQRSAQDLAVCLSQQDEDALLSNPDSLRSEAVLCVPMDRRLPLLRLRSRHLLPLVKQRFVVRVDTWPRNSKHPTCHFVRSLGALNDMRAETDAVLVKAGIEWQPFSESAMAELPRVADPSQWTVPDVEVCKRRDLRSADYLICSIDPPGCTDVDDALSVRELPSGEIEVGVHIADVSHFVPQGGFLDGEAAARCTTVYLVDRRLDMLPSLLSEHLCSLRARTDRLAVSVLWTLSPDLEVRDVWFGRTIIRSRYQLEYQQAQDIMDGRPPQPEHDSIAMEDRPRLQQTLQTLARVAAHLRAGRLQDGALELESAELRFETAAEGQPTEVTGKAEVPMMAVVAEMMIFANSAVARRIHQAFPSSALLRRHPPPRQDAFKEVEALCEAGGCPLDTSSNAALSRSLEAAVVASGDPAIGSLIKSLVTRAMSEAEYFSSGDARPGGGGLSHFGLALAYYTHFTSPIRRYADVVVHRQLIAALSSPDAAPPVHHSKLQQVTGTMNERHRQAKRAQRECSDLYLLFLLHSKPHVEAAILYEIQPTGALLFVPKYHMKGAVQLTDRAGRPIPLLRKGVGDDLNDPFAVAERQKLTLHHGADSVSIVDRDTGEERDRLSAMQRVWVMLGCDGSRAHGPRLRMRILHPSHPSIPAHGHQAAQVLERRVSGKTAQQQAPATQTLEKTAAAEEPALEQPASLANILNSFSNLSLGSEDIQSRAFPGNAPQIESHSGVWHLLLINFYSNGAN
ncbi:DIS3-like exonuclease 1 [Coccomyxa sp. Obi]|nr:DIS3-like exonuclease 1 [Coccomyxa sp. Obi]